MASVAYGTMKAAMFFYVKSYARKVAKHGIRANLVSPGTTFFEGGFWDKVKTKRPRRALPTLIAFNPMGRMATADEIADVSSCSSASARGELRVGRQCGG